MQAYGTSGETPSSLAEEYMTNTSKVPILRPVDAFERLRPVYPQFFENVWPVSMEAVLEPGDMLVMPPGWWHAMRAEGDEPCWNVSMWY
jgi:lysine-specific demethylase 8